MTRNSAFAFATSMLLPVAFGTLAVATARAQESTIGIHVSNEEFDDIFVTLIDANSGQSKRVLDNYRINHGSRADVQVVKDSSSHGKVTWTSKSAPSDPNKVKCGKGQDSGFSVGAEIKITARSSC